MNKNNSMINPSIVDLLKKVDNRYSLVVATSRRARQLIDGVEPHIADKDGKPLTIAINEVNEGAIDVTPRMTKTEMETAIKEGKYTFKVDSAQNVTTLYDINSLTTVGENKNNSFKKNRTIRTLDGINNDTVNIFESNYIGNINNNTDGRSLLRSAYIEYFNLIQNLNAIQNFTAEDVEVLEGKDKEAVVINCNIQTVDSVEKMYITINLS